MQETQTQLPSNAIAKMTQVKMKFMKLRTNSYVKINDYDMANLRYELDGRLKSDIQETPKPKLPPITNTCKKTGVGAKTCDCADCRKRSSSEVEMKKHILSQNQKNMLTDYISIMDEMEKLKQIYFSEFLRALQTKMAEQEKILERVRRNNATRKGSRMSALPLLGSRSSRKSISESLPDKFLEQIVHVQKTFIKQGKIQSPDDMDKFWQDVQKPEFQSQHLSKSQHTVLPNVSSINMVPELPPDDDHIDTVHWAVALANQRHITKEPDKHVSWTEKAKQKALKAEKSVTTTTPTKQQRDKRAGSERISFNAGPSYLESKPFPALYCLREKSETKVEDDSEKLAEIAAMRQARKKNRRLVNKMYQLALANQALTNRLLQKHGDDLAFNMDRVGASVKDILQLYPKLTRHASHVPTAAPCRPRARLKRRGVVPRKSDQPMRTLAELVDMRDQMREEINDDRDVTDSEDDSVRSLGVGRSFIKKFNTDTSPSTPNPGTPLSLSMSTLGDELKTVTAKCRSSLWQNYARSCSCADWSLAL